MMTSKQSNNSSSDKKPPRAIASTIAEKVATSKDATHRSGTPNDVVQLKLSNQREPEGHGIFSTQHFLGSDQGSALKPFAPTQSHMPGSGIENSKGQSPFIQPKLTINAPGDQYEQEADAIADKVMRMPANNLPFSPPSATISSIQRRCKNCEDDEKVHRKETSSQPIEAGDDVSAYVSSLSSKGSPMPDSVKNFFEPRFGHDFSNVRVHTDTVAAKSAQSINALAYTTGNNIVFNHGQYAPGSASGQRLMAHELTHVVQQSGKEANAMGAKVSRKSPKTSSKTDITDDDLKKLEDDIVTAATANGLLKLLPASVKKQWGQLQTAIAGGKSSQYYGDDIKLRLLKLSPAQRKTVDKDVFSAFFENYKNSNNEKINYKNEYNQLSNRIKNNIEGGQAGYIAIRDAFMAQFQSSFNANYYYDTLVGVNSPWSELRGGKGILVHPEMSKSLNSASDLLKSKGILTGSLKDIGINEIGGFNIRENRNNTKALSEHSYGFAVDIDADLNPNASKANFPAKFVKEFAGVDVYDKETLKGLAHGSDFDDAHKSAQTLTDASDVLKDSFLNETNLGLKLIEYIHHYQQLKTIQLPHPEIWTKKYTGDALISLLKNKDEQGLKDCATLAGFTGKDQTTVIAFLKDAYSLFLKTFQKEKGKITDKKIPANSSGSQQTIAANGFISIPSEIIAALVSKQGGGLQWLGAVSGGAKDFMHFELNPKPAITVFGDFLENTNKTEGIA